MKINMTKPVQIDCKYIYIHMKVRDEFSFQLQDQDSEVLFDQKNDYVPNFMPGERYGGYLILKIEIDTGKVVNWKKITPEDLEKYLNHGSAE